MRYYVHGAGTTGIEAWPTQPRDGSVFADHSGTPHMAQKAALVAEQAPAEPFILIAHSLGSVASALAIRDHALRPTHLVLGEPALYDLGRGNAAVEAHIATMNRAKQKARESDLYGYWQIVRPMMFGQQATRAEWETVRPFVEDFAALESPWGHRLQASMFATIPTLVIHGNWNAEYVAIAREVQRGAASALVLAGNEHNVQDHPAFNEAVDRFVTASR